MRTNIDIDDELLAEAMKATGKTTKRATVEEALRRVTRHNRLKELIERTRGMGWEGHLDQLRESNTIAEEGARFKDRE
jgi:Arc/MetJ family transcription regulator